MERGDHYSVLLNVNAVLQGIGSTNFPGGIGTGRAHLGFWSWGVVRGEVSGKLLRPKWGFSERRGLVGLQNGEKIRDFAFAVPNRQISKFLVNLRTQQQHVSYLVSKEPNDRPLIQTDNLMMGTSVLHRYK